MRCPRKRFSSGEDAWELKNRWEYRSRKKVISNWTRNCLQAKITSLVRDKCSLSWNNCKGSNTEVLKRIWTQITSRGGGGEHIYSNHPWGLRKEGEQHQQAVTAKCGARDPLLPPHSSAHSAGRRCPSLPVGWCQKSYCSNSAPSMRWDSHPALTCADGRDSREGGWENSWGSVPKGRWENIWE